MKRLLELLRENARMSTREIAKRLGKTPREVSAAIRRLEREGTICGYHAVVNPDREPGPARVLGIIEVKVTPQRGVGFDAVALRISRHREVRTCYLISGDADLVLLVEGRSLKEIADFVAHRLSGIEGITATSTHFLLRKYKEHGVLLHSDGDGAERLPVTP